MEGKWHMLGNDKTIIIFYLCLNAKQKLSIGVRITCNFQKNVIIWNAPLALPIRSNLSQWQ